MYHENPNAEGGSYEPEGVLYFTCQQAGCAFWVDDEEADGKCAIKAIAERLPK